MDKILGLDTGTNSLGWAIVTKHDNGEYSLHEHGVNIFQEGVKIEKGIESSRAAERTEHRSLRKHYWRRKVRKTRLLTVLSQENLCPPVNKEEVRLWRCKGIYPQNDAFRLWQRTDDDKDVNPYHFRYICLTRKLDLTDVAQRYILGRAFYHINQRRGFKSNRKDSSQESDGAVKTGITTLSEDMVNAGCNYLGEYFYKLYQSGEKIRNHYTDREEHYLREFRAICSMQQLDDELVDKLERVIFSQRPLKSQKQSIGKCLFEPRKARCSTSHPLYEEYRMYAFINNIKIKTPADLDLRRLTTAEKQSIMPLFYRKSKSTFTFEDIAKKLSSGKNSYCYAGDEVKKPYVFNYHLDTQVSGCPVIAQLREIFGDDWVAGVRETYVLGENKSDADVINDIWHVLFSYDDKNCLKEFARNRLQLSDSDAEKFSDIRMPHDYASLSLKAINNILPYLKEYGMIYSYAVFFGKLRDIVPSYVAEDDKQFGELINDLLEYLNSEPEEEGATLEHRIKGYLKERYCFDNDDVKALYHPSMIELYPRQRPNAAGIYQLGSPRINSVRNPMAMHALFRLRKVVNQLLASGKVDENTVIHIEFARELNDANRRKAILDNERNNEKQRAKYRDSLMEVYREQGIERAPSDIDILKYQLWEEQNHICVYTGETISFTDLFGSNPKYDIEHTVPRSVGGDSTKMNLTLCNSRFNRDVKKAQLPSQLANHADVLQRVAPWKKTYEDLDRQIRKLRGSSATDKAQKDAIIQKKHRLSLQRDYWRGKYQRFTMTEVPEGFSRRQGTDISVISRYARLYLRSVFRKVFIVKGIATSDFRKLWGIQNEYEKKQRVNHAHHCIDAITVACIGPDEYGKLAHYYHQLEDSEMYGKDKPKFDKPWTTFTTDIEHIPDELIVAHYTCDNMPKSARRRIVTPEGRVLAKGDVARGSLHLDTFYGAIARDGNIKYVVRRDLATMAESDIQKIVDDSVRECVAEAVAKHKTLKAAVEADDVWMNREKGVRIKRVRVYADSVARPIDIRHQRDMSRHEYKRQYHLQNDRNYMMAIYIGKDAKGKEKREFELVRNIDAANHYRRSNATDIPLVPEKSRSGYTLAYQLKPGTKVLLYENSVDEILACDRKDLCKRLYTVIGLSSMVISRYTYGTICLEHHQEARQGKDLKAKNGVFKSNEEYRPRILFYHTQIKALVEGVDFEINELGEITLLR